MCEESGVGIYLTISGVHDISSAAPSWRVLHRAPMDQSISMMCGRYRTAAWRGMMTLDVRDAIIYGQLFRGRTKNGIRNAKYTEVSNIAKRVNRRRTPTGHDRVLEKVRSKARRNNGTAVQRPRR